MKSSYRRNTRRKTTNVRVRWKGWKGYNSDSKKGDGKDIVTTDRGDYLLTSLEDVLDKQVVWNAKATDELTTLSGDLQLREIYCDSLLDFEQIMQCIINY